MAEPQPWKVNAFDSQVKFFETLGSRPYDEIEKSNTFLLKKKVGFATCGKPGELPSFSNYFTGYSKEQLEDITTICTKIIEKSYYDPIRFSCTMLVLHHKGAYCDSPVFRIATKSGTVFIDPYARVYETWADFLRDNRLPECEFCFPLDGEYSQEKAYLFDYTKSPASTVVSKAGGYLDTAGSVTSVAAAGVFTAGMFITVAPVVASVVGAAATFTGVYGLSRSIRSLIDRRKHDQSIGLKDRESRSAWMSIGSSAVGVATVGLVDTGSSVSNLGQIGLQALNVSSFAFSGFGFVEAVFAFGEQYKKGGLTKKDIFDMSCELLFLFNAIASTNATTTLMIDMGTAISSATPAQRSKMTKTQIRNFRRRRVKTRAAGLIPHESVSSEEDNELIKKGHSVVQALLLEASKVYLPREEEISLRCQFIGHDIACWKNHRISDSVLTNNLRKNLVKLKNEYKTEVAESVVRVEHYFNSITFHRLRRDMLTLFKNSSEETKFVFCTKVINMEDLVDGLLNNAERDILDMQERLKIETNDASSETIDDDFVFLDALTDAPTQLSDDDNETAPYFMKHEPSSFSTHDFKQENERVPYKINTREGENLNDSYLNPEVQSLFARCGEVVQAFSLYCNNLKDLGEILDAVKYVVANNFKTRMSIYKGSLETSKSTLGDCFDIEIFQKTLNIPGTLQDVAVHMFNKSLESLTDDSISKIKTKYKEIKKVRDARSTLFWENMAEGIFQFYQFFGDQGAGLLTKSSLLSVVSTIVNIQLSEKNSKIVESGDVVMIEISDKPNLYAVVQSDLTGENTTSGIIHVVK